MVRPIAYLAVALFAGAPLRASELDADFGAATPAAPAATLKAISPAAAATAPLPAPIRDDRTDVGKESELDAESPAQSCFFFRRGLGWGGYGLGWGGGYGLGWGDYGLGWGGYGLGWGGWGGGYGP